MKVIRSSTQLRIALLMSALMFASSFSVAQDTAQSQQTPSGGIRVDPSAGPLTPGEPVPNQPAQTSLPEAPQPAPQQRPVPPARSAAQEPLGAAAAEQIRTAGGGASRPAGNAIAPAKQHQYRSLLIKLGAVAAGSIAVGTVYALSHATPSTPPHSASATK